MKIFVFEWITQQHIAAFVVLEIHKHGKLSYIALQCMVKISFPKILFMEEIDSDISMILTLLGI